jgi:hypothetical protein
LNKSAVIAMLLANASAKQAVDVVKMEQIAEGLLMGALDAEGFTDIASCIKDVSTFVSDTEVAYADFKKKDVQSIIAGVKEIGEMIKVVKNGMADCSSLKADWEKFAAMAAIFESPTSLVYHVGKDLVVNGKSIYKEINAGITQYEAQNWKGFGYQIGEAAAKLLLGEESQTNIKVAKMLQGAMKPFGGDFDLYALLICIYEEDQAALILDEAVKELIAFKSGHDFNDLLGGVILTIAAIQQAKQGLPACEAIDSSMWQSAKFDQCDNLMAHPQKHFTMTENDLLINGVSIVKDVLEAVAAYEAGDFETFGEKMGEVAKLSTEPKVTVPVPVSKTMTKKNVAEIAQGLLKSTNVGSFNLEDLLICIYEADQAALILYEGVDILEKAFADKDVGEAIGGLIAVVAFVQQLKKSLPVCESVVSDPMEWGKFNHIVEVIESPAHHMEVIGKNIILNGRDITVDIAKALSSWRSGNFEQFGEQLGDALSLATEENVLKMDKVDKKTMVAEIAQGFLEATNVGTFDLETLLICIYEADQAALILYEAVNIFEEAWTDKDPMEAIGGAIATIAFLQQLKQSIPVCKSVAGKSYNWSTFDTIIEDFEQPKEHM